MGDVWRSRTPRAFRKSRRLGTVDGRLIGASPVPSREQDTRPNDEVHPILFNSGGEVQAGSMSPPYIANQDGIILGLRLTVKSGSVRANVYIQGVKRATISHSGSGYSAVYDLDLGVDADEFITVSYDILGGAPEDAVTTVSFLED